jgi:hypothetical protein
MNSLLLWFNSLGTAVGCAAVNSLRKLDTYTGLLFTATAVGVDAGLLANTVYSFPSATGLYNELTLVQTAPTTGREPPIT